MTTTSTTERRSRRWTLGALAASVAALVPPSMAPERAVAATSTMSETSETDAGSRPRPTSHIQRGTWEYALYDLQTVQATRYNSFFNQLGNDGWELVGMSAYTPIGSRDGAHVLVTFKRPK